MVGRVGSSQRASSTPRPVRFAIAIAAADGPPVDELLALLRDVTDNDWYGSDFFK
jgi:hypothetical protein